MLFLHRLHLSCFKNSSRVPMQDKTIHAILTPGKTATLIGLLVYVDKNSLLFLKKGCCYTLVNNSVVFYFITKGFG